MTDAKVNMSLDDIIKMNKKAAFPRKNQAGAGRGGRGGGRGAARAGVNARAGGAVRGVARGGAVRGGARGGKFGGAARRGAIVNKRVATGAVRATTAATNAQTKKLVNALVKKALRTRLGGAVAARPLAAANRGVALGRAGGVLSRLNARSRVINKRAPVVAQPVVHTVQTVRRGRGFRAAQEEEDLYEDEIDQPVVIQRPRVRAARPSVVVKRVVEAPRIQRVIQQQPRQQRVIVQRQPVRQRVIQRVQQQPLRQRIQQQRVIQRPQQQRVIVVERQAPVQRVQKVIQRVQRPQIIRQRQQPRTEVVEYVQARTRKNNNFRNAMGIGGGRRYEEVQVDRFEPSSSFLGRQVVRRGRGFQNY